MALYEQYVGRAKVARAFTIDGSEDDARHAALVADGAGGWRRVEDVEGAGNHGPAPSATFDPAGHTVPEVLAHLDTADLDEATRVLDAEAAEGGKQRAGVLNLREEILARKQPDQED